MISELLLLLFAALTVSFLVLLSTNDRNTAFSTYKQIRLSRLSFKLFPLNFLQDPLVTRGSSLSSFSSSCSMWHAAVLVEPAFSPLCLVLAFERSQFLVSHFLTRGGFISPTQLDQLQFYQSQASRISPLWQCEQQHTHSNFYSTVFLLPLWDLGGVEAHVIQKGGLHTIQDYHRVWILSNSCVET